MLSKIQGTIRFKEPLSIYTSLRMGGPADIFIMPQDIHDIRYALQFARNEQLPVIVIGNGSNLLVGERGIRGVVLKLEGCLGRAEFHGDEALAGAGVNLSALIREAAALNLGGLEVLAGIPATVGGALATNAGSQKGHIGDFVSAVYFVRRDGELREYNPARACGHHLFSVPSDVIIVGCRLQLRRANYADINREISQAIKQIKATQPFILASAGPIWDDPPGDTAVRLITRVGLKSKRCNGAEISVKNPNFIINRGNATTVDVCALMDMTKERVHNQYSIVLNPRIKIIGE